MSSAISERRRIGIIQSNYIPWKGYFDFIASCDAFVILDEVQYTRRDWRNRNLVKTEHGLKWLTVPVAVKGKYDQPINQTRISDGEWFASHLRSLRHAFARAAHFSGEWPFVEQLFLSLKGEPLLSYVNEALLRKISARLGITTPIYRSEQFDATPGKNERLISICRQLQATEYLSGPAAKGYIDESQWARSGITVKYKSYAGYREYAQIHPPFEHAVTILDVLFNTGPDAAAYIRSALPEEATNA